MIEINIETLDSGLIYVTLTGRLDLPGTQKIENPFSFQVTSKKASVLVDMSGVDFIASIGMRLLLTSARAVESRGGQLGLLNMTERVNDAVKTAGIDQLISAYTDFDQASSELLAALSD